MKGSFVRAISGQGNTPMTPTRKPQKGLASQCAQLIAQLVRQQAHQEEILLTQRTLIEQHYDHMLTYIKEAQNESLNVVDHLIQNINQVFSLKIAALRNTIALHKEQVQSQEKEMQEINKLKSMEITTMEIVEAAPFSDFKSKIEPFLYRVVVKQEESLDCDEELGLWRPKKYYVTDVISEATQSNESSHGR